MRMAKVLGLPAVLVLGTAGAIFACGDDGGTTPANADAGGGTSSSSGSSGTSSGVEDAGPTDVGPVDDGGLGPSFEAYDINYVLGTGQSLSVGSQGAPALSTEQPDQNLMFNGGVRPGGTPANLTSFVPLVEAATETLSAPLANHISGNAKDTFGIEHAVLVSAHGVGGYRYDQLRKGQAPYANGIAQAKAAVALARGLNQTIVVRAVTNVHGESDHVAKSTTYQADLAQWQSDYETDVRLITGQSQPIPMLHTQMHSWTRYRHDNVYTATSRIPIDQLAAHVASGGKTILVGPKYHVEYSADGVHLTNDGYRHMAEDYAKVYRHVVLRGKTWEPVRPVAVTREGDTIRIKFAVPAPPLVLDEKAVKNPGKLGFELSGGASAPDITSVAVTSDDTVTIKLSAAPAGNVRIRYAYTGEPGARGGPATGARGNLRDSDPTRSLYGFDLWNWCVTFDEAVP